MTRDNQSQLKSIITIIIPSSDSTAVLSIYNAFGIQNPIYMQANSSKTIKTKDLSVDEPFNSLSQSNHGIQSSTSRRTSSSSSSSGTWSVRSIPRRSTLTFIRRTPTEVLAHIFSYLDPEGFANASLVCREWHDVVTDDYAWKTAFDKVYGSKNVVSRISNTWRGEYIHRSHLLRYYSSDLVDIENGKPVVVQ